MKSIASILCLSLLTSITASAAVNDLPSAQWLCREQNKGGILADGAKTLTVFKDQFGVHALRMVQKDQFSGDSVLLDNIVVQKQNCVGFTPCEMYSTSNVKFFINLVGKTQYQEGHLDLTNATKPASFEFVCKRLQP